MINSTAKPDSVEMVKNRFGFFEMKHKPDEKTLENYYAHKYYQESLGYYDKEYTPEEIQYFLNKIEQRFKVIQSHFAEEPQQTRKLLDVGCGEGWTLQYFKKQSWQVLGLDYSESGCKGHNPDCLDDLMIGNIYANLDRLAEQDELFDCIWLDNVLEHVIDPYALVEQCRKLVHSSGMLVIEVPNDFSPSQERLYKEGYISRQFWVQTPDHISYFNRDGLINLCSEAGWRDVLIMADYWIDFDLFNPNSNYVENPSIGKASHYARVKIENLLHDISPEKTNRLYEVLAEMGLGRQIIGFFKPA